MNDQRTQIVADGYDAREPSFGAVVASCAADWLQLAIHPELWVHGSVAALCAAKGEQWFGHLDADGLELR